MDTIHVVYTDAMGGLLVELMQLGAYGLGVGAVLLALRVAWAVLGFFVGGPAVPESETKAGRWIREGREGKMD